MEKILNWYGQQCEEADFNRIGIMAFILLFQTCLVVPAAVLLISMNGQNLIELAIIAVLSFSLLVSLLGDAPARVVIPLFLISTIVHLFIIVLNAL